jgi:predicted DNA-binding protein
MERVNDLFTNDDKSGTNGWKHYRVLAGEHIEEDEVLLTVGKHTFVSRGNMQTVSGKPKSCKTFLTSAMAGACLNGEYMGITATRKDLTILMFDTEQGNARAQKVVRRVYRMCGLSYNEENNHLVAVSVRELDPGKRMNALVGAITDTKPDLVILDGVRDLLTDFNDIKQSAELVNSLMALSVDFKCAIVTVIHQNKGDANARGHLGSELMNKSETAAEVVRADKISTVKPVFCRNEEFEEFSFRIDDTGLPVLCDALVERDSKGNSVRSVIEKAMFGSTQMLRTNIRSKIEALTGKSGRTGNRIINEAIELGILELMPDNDKMLRLVVEAIDELDEDEDTYPF